MIVGGWNKVSLVNYPGEIATVLFTCGCNLRCVYCHNMELASMDNLVNGISEDEIIRYLKSRLGKVSALVISGGEPLLSNTSHLIDFINKVHEELPELKVKVDTNGINVNNLKALLRGTHIDYIAMDIKYNLWSNNDRYLNKIADNLLVNKTSENMEVIQNYTDSIKKSIDVLVDNMINKDLSIEFRTTCDKRVLNIDHIFSIVNNLNDILINKYGESIDGIGNITKIKDKVSYSIQKLHLDDVKNNIRFHNSLNLSTLVKILQRRSKYIKVNYLNS